MKVVYGDPTTAVDPSDALAISRSFPLTYGQPLVQLTPHHDDGTPTEKLRCLFDAVIVTVSA